MNDNSVAESLSNMQKDGQISENDLAEVTKRLAVGEELKETFVSTEEPESNSDLPSSNKKKEKLSSKIAKSKAKTRQMFEEARVQNFEEFNAPLSEHPASMFPEPVVLDRSSSSVENRSNRRISKMQTTGRSSSRSEVGDREAEQTHEDFNQSLEEEHIKNVKKEKKINKERRRRREAREFPQTPTDPAVTTPVNPNPLLSKLDPAIEPSNIDKAMMAKEEETTFFAVRITNLPCNSTLKLSSCVLVMNHRMRTARPRPIMEK